MEKELKSRVFDYLSRYYEDGYFDRQHNNQPTNEHGAWANAYNYKKAIDNLIDAFGLTTNTAQEWFSQWLSLTNPTAYGQRKPGFSKERAQFIAEPGEYYDENYKNHLTSDKQINNYHDPKELDEQGYNDIVGLPPNIIDSIKHYSKYY